MVYSGLVVHVLALPCNECARVFSPRWTLNGQHVRNFADLCVRRRPSETGKHTALGSRASAPFEAGDYSSRLSITCIVIWRLRVLFHLYDNTYDSAVADAGFEPAQRTYVPRKLGPGGDKGAGQL